MFKTISSYYSRTWQGVRQSMSWLWAIPNALYQGFAWFSSKRIDWPDTEEGRLMRDAVRPNSWFDKSTTLWVESPFWIKVGALTLFSVMGGLLGLFVGAPVLASLTTFILGVFVHGALGAHHHHRVEHVQRLMKESIAVRKEVKETVLATQRQVIAQMEAHKKGVAEHVAALAQEANSVHEATTHLVAQVDEVDKTNKELHAVHTQLHTTVDELHEDAKVFAVITEEVKAHHEGVHHAVDAFKISVDEVEESAKELKEVVIVLHHAVVSPQTPQQEEGSNECEVLDGDEVVVEELARHEVHKKEVDTFIAAFDARQKAVPVEPIEELRDTHVHLQAHTKDVLAQLEERQRKRAIARAALDELSRPVTPAIACDVVVSHAGDASVPTQLCLDNAALLDTTEQPPAFNPNEVEELKAHHTQVMDVHDKLVQDIEMQLKLRAARRAHGFKPVLAKRSASEEIYFPGPQ